MANFAHHYNVHKWSPEAIKKVQQHDRDNNRDALYHVHSYDEMEELCRELSETPNNSVCWVMVNNPDGTLARLDRVNRNTGVLQDWYRSIDPDH